MTTTKKKTTPAKTKPVGRPSKYRDEYAQLAYRLALLGHTDAEMARVFDTTEQTINAWKQAYPQFLESITAGKDAADSKVIESLFKKAIGYEHEAVKIVADAKTGMEHIVPYVERYAPDTAAAIFWLKNRQRGKWRDRIDQEVTGADGGPVAVVQRIELVALTSRDDSAD